MPRDWSMKDLEYWDKKIVEKVEEFGLDCFPQEFEVCDHLQMLGYMAYSGMPSHYPHWSYGKSFEKQKTMYDHGASGLPYEMVINSDPSLAYLMQDNSLTLQVLTIAHVYGHNDFFKNNYTFRDTHPELTLSNFKLRAERVRNYAEDPSIGARAVEDWLDAAHALAYQCRRYPAKKKLTEREQRERAMEKLQPKDDPYHDLSKPEEKTMPDLSRVPLEPEEDVLLFIRDHNPNLATWQRDLLTIVHEQAQYFIPQIETKIMNEGWASYWHHRIMHSLDLPQDMHMEFLVHHNQVIRPHPGSINPYHVGFMVWHDIIRSCDERTPEEIEMYGPSDRTGEEKMFQVREVDRDASFLRRFLNRQLMEDLDMFQYGQRGDDLVVEKVSDEDDWKDVRNTLVANVGMASMPVIQITNADHENSRTLYLEHSYDGRELELEYAEKTLNYLHHLWGRRVILATMLNDKHTELCYDETGFKYD